MRHSVKTSSLQSNRNIHNIHNNNIHNKKLMPLASEINQPQLHPNTVNYGHIQLRHHLCCSSSSEKSSLLKYECIGNSDRDQYVQEDYWIYFSTRDSICGYNEKTKQKRKFFGIFRAICMTSGFGYILASQVGNRLTVHEISTETTTESNIFNTRELSRSQLNSVKLYNFGTEDNRLRMISCHNNGTFRVYSFPELEFIQNIDAELSLVEPSSKINYNNLCLSPSLEYLCAVIDNSDKAIFWKYNPAIDRFENGKDVSLFESQMNMAMACDWSPDSQLIAIGDLECVVYDYNSSVVRQRYKKEESLIRVVRFSPNKDIPLLIYAEEDGLVFCVNYKLWNRRQRIECGGGATLGGLDFSTDGSRFYIGTSVNIRTFASTGCSVRPLQQLCIDSICLARYPTSQSNSLFMSSPYISSNITRFDEAITRYLPQYLIDDIKEREIELEKAIQIEISNQHHNYIPQPHHYHRRHHHHQVLEHPSEDNNINRNNRINNVLTHQRRISQGSERYPNLFLSILNFFRRENYQRDERDFGRYSDSDDDFY